MEIEDSVKHEYHKVLARDIRKRVENNPYLDHREIKKIYHEQINRSEMYETSRILAKNLVNRLVDMVFLG